MPATDGVEQVELDEPWRALVDAGAEPSPVGLAGGSITASDHIEAGATRTVDVALADADAVAFVSAFSDADERVAAICHAPWVLIEAGAVRGRRMTA